MKGDGRTDPLRQAPSAGVVFGTAAPMPISCGLSAQDGTDEPGHEAMGTRMTERPMSNAGPDDVSRS